MISFGGNYMYFQSQQLDEPVFLDHYYEFYMHDNMQQLMSLYYLSNKNDASIISHVSVDDVTLYVHRDPYFFMEDGSPSYDKEFRYHYLRSVELYLQSYTLMEKMETEGELKFEHMTIHYEDGSSSDVNVGQVHIQGTYPNGHGAFGNGTSEGYITQQKFISYAQQPVTIEEIEVPLDLLHHNVVGKVQVDNGQVELVQNSEQLEQPQSWVYEHAYIGWTQTKGMNVAHIAYPFTLAEGDRLETFWQFHPKKPAYYQFAIKIKGKTATGESFNDINLVWDKPYLNQEDVNYYTETKGGRK